MPSATPAPISVTPEHGRRIIASMNHRPTTPRRQAPTSIEQALAALHVADAAARSELPTPARGFEWHADLVIGSSGTNAVTARIEYTVRPIVTELSPRRPIE